MKRRRTSSKIEPPKKTVNHVKVAALISLAAFIAYCLTQSASLDDWDSVQFALGVREYNVQKHQPHPPGYPIYILFGKIFNLFLGDERLSLTLMSSFFGALSVFTIYLLGKEMFNEGAALASSVLAAVTPLFWMNSVMAMSDMTSLFFVLATLLLFYRHMARGEVRYFYAGSILLGITSGVRIHTIFILLPVFAYAIAFKVAKWREKLIGVVLLMLAVSLWLIPVFALEGIEGYSKTAYSLLAWRAGRSTVSIVGTEWTAKYLTDRLYAFLYYYLLGGYGVNIRDASPSDWLMLALMAIPLALSLKGQNIRNPKFMLFSLSTAFYLLMLYTILTPSNPRYLLPLVPLTTLALTAAIWKMNKPLKYGLFATLLLLLLAHSLPLAVGIKNEPTPPLQLINYVNEKYGNSALVVLSNTSDARRHFDYYAGNLTLIYKADCDRLTQELSQNKTVLTIIPYNQCPSLKLNLIHTFKRDPRIHVKHHLEYLLQYKL
jgi:4-amino-4-deoxy-L-arabinose transferase-like glycosyltransferase